MTWDEAKAQCSEGIVPACHNAERSVTISGSADMMVTFVDKLNSEDIFVKEVDSSEVPFHSPHLVKAGKRYQTALQKVD